METAITEPNKRIRFKRKAGDEVHASGTVIHWDVRDPEDPYWSIGITCHECKLDRFAPKASIKNPSWKGLTGGTDGLTAGGELHERACAFAEGRFHGGRKLLL